MVVLMAALSLGLVFLMDLKPAGFVLGGVLWTAIPLMIGTTMARRGGDNIALAGFATLFFGWIGLAIVILGQGKRCNE